MSAAVTGHRRRPRSPHLSGGGSLPEGRGSAGRRPHRSSPGPTAAQAAGRALAVGDTGDAASATSADEAWSTCDALVQRVEEGRLVPLPAARGESATAFGRLCAQPLLTAAEEQSLFRQRDLRRDRAAQLHRELVESPPRGRGARRRCSDLQEAWSDALARAERLRNYLVVSNVRLAVSLAKKFVAPETSLDTAVSAAIWSLLNAVEKFDHRRGFRFSTYATQAIRRDLYRLVVKNHAYRQRFSGGGDAEAAETDAAETPGRSVTVACGPADYEAISAMLDRLDPRERLILRSRFGFDSLDGRKSTYIAIGEELGVSKERARQLAERALEKMRTWAPAFGLESP